MIKTEATLLEKRLRDDLQGIVDFHTTKQGHDPKSKSSLLAAYQVLLLADKMITEATKALDTTAETIVLQNHIYAAIDRFERDEIDVLRDRYLDEVIAATSTTETSQ